MKLKTFWLEEEWLKHLVLKFCPHIPKMKITVMDRLQWNFLRSNRQHTNRSNHFMHVFNWNFLSESKRALIKEYWYNDLPNLVSSNCVKMCVCRFLTESFFFFSYIEYLTWLMDCFAKGLCSKRTRSMVNCFYWDVWEIKNLQKSFHHLLYMLGVRESFWVIMFVCNWTF